MAIELTASRADRVRLATAARCARRARRPILLALLLCVASCASPPPPRTLVLRVSNQLGRPVAEIRSKPCEAGEYAMEPLEDSRLGPGDTKGFVLPPSCVDLVAYDERGRVVGEQRELRMMPGASWVLRR
ncbi:MAG: hypothetical protein H6748_17050 [Spirochaetaceae bacterium]|nr:hypothetical protein [Spirochaetaceae bacterium]